VQSGGYPHHALGLVMTLRDAWSRRVRKLKGLLPDLPVTAADQ
jgi:hypothetical protein